MKLLSLVGSPAPIHHHYSLHSMAVSSGARQSGEAAKTGASCSLPNLLAVSLPSPAFTTLRAQKPPCYAGYHHYFPPEIRLYLIVSSTFWPLVFSLSCFVRIFNFIRTGVLYLDMWRKVDFKEYSFDYSYWCKDSRLSHSDHISIVSDHFKKIAVLFLSQILLLKLSCKRPLLKNNFLNQKNSTYSFALLFFSRKRPPVTITYDYKKTTAQMSQKFCADQACWKLTFLDCNITLMQNVIYSFSRSKCYYMISFSTEGRFQSRWSGPPILRLSFTEFHLWSACLWRCRLRSHGHTKLSE